LYSQPHRKTVIPSFADSEEPPKVRKYFRTF
jgi:hypothetical protein